MKGFIRSMYHSLDLLNYKGTEYRNFWIIIGV